MPRPLTLLLAITCLWLTACADGGITDASGLGDDVASEGDGGEPMPTDEAGLIGATWTLWAGSGPDGDVPVIEDWPITIVFKENTVGGQAACNDYSGSYSIDGSALSINELSQQEMGCEPDVQASEQAFLGALIGVEGIDLSGDELVLSGPATELVFRSEAPLPNAELIGQEWLLDTLLEGDTASTVQGEPATLLLDEDGTFTGSTGCRTFSGSFTISGNQVQFANFSMDDQDCPAELSAQDSSVVTVLGDGFTAEVSDDRLTLTSAGAEGLSYRLADS